MHDSERTLWSWSGNEQKRLGVKKFWYDSKLNESSTWITAKGVISCKPMDKSSTNGKSKNIRRIINEKQTLSRKSSKRFPRNSRITENLPWRHGKRSACVSDWKLARQDTCLEREEGILRSEDSEQLWNVPRCQWTSRIPSLRYMLSRDTGLSRHTRN